MGEGKLAQAVLQRREVEVGHGEDLRRRHEGDLRAGAVAGIALHRQRYLRVAATEAHEVLFAATPDGELEPLAERVHDRDTDAVQAAGDRSEEHTSELQSLMRISYAVFCLKKKKKQH